MSTTRVTTIKIQVDNEITHENMDVNNEIEEGEASTSSDSDIEVKSFVKDNDHRVKKRTSDKDENNLIKNKPVCNSTEENSDLHYYPISPEQNVYANKTLEGRLDGRIKRFGVVHSTNTVQDVSKEKLAHLYKSLDIEENDFHRGGWRSNAIHVKGIYNLQSEDIFEYFEAYCPYNIEWLDKDTCNVIWENKREAAEALIGLSCPVTKNKITTRQPLSNTNLVVPITKKETSVQNKKKLKVNKKLVKIINVDHVSKTSSGDESSSSSSDDDSSSGSSNNSNSSSSESSSSGSSSDSTSSSSDSEGVDDETKCKQGSPKPSDAIMREIGQQSEILPGSICASAIGVQMPSGNWRLGIPCPNTKALFLRYAHCKDKKASGLSKPVDFYEERTLKNTSKIQVKERMDDRNPKREYREARRRLKRNPDSEESSSISQMVSPLPAEKNVSEGYIDLDEPSGDDTKNPWGYLAQNWNKKSTRDNLDYHSLLRQHVTGKNTIKRTRVADESTDYLYSDKRHRYSKNSNRYSYSEDESEDDQVVRESGPDNWNEKIKVPRMRMYADVEEKLTKKLPNEVKHRIGHRQTISSHRISRKEPPPTTNQFDLRTKLRRNQPRRRRSDGE